MNWILLIMGILVLLLSWTGIIGQGKLLVYFVGEKKAKVINLISGFIFIILSFLI